MFIGVIADGNWKVAQYYSSLMQDAPDYQAEVILDCLKMSSDNLRNNLQYCKFITTFEEVTKEMIEEHPTLSPYLGASILNEIARCNGNTVYLTDSRDFLKSDIACRFAFVINYDTGKIQYFTGSRRFSSQNRFDPGYKNLRTKWFCNIFIDSHFKSEKFIAFFCSCREHHDRYL